MGVLAMETRVYELIPEGSIIIVLGRSRSAFLGIKILPESIDHDYAGEIKVMIEAEVGVLVIPQW